MQQMNRATAETQKEISEEEGLAPVLAWVKDLIDQVIAQEFGAPDLEFTFSADPSIDPQAQEAILTSYTSKGILTINEARAALGRDPLAEPAANKPMALTGQGYVALGQQAEAAGKRRDRVVKFNPYHDDIGRFTTAADAVYPVADTGQSGRPIDLREEEQRGGHTIADHVGKSQEYLLSIIRDDAQETQSRGDFFQGLREGSFPSLEAANKLVNSTVAQNQDKVDLVVNGLTPGQQFDAFFDSPTGYEAYAKNERSQSYIRETFGVRVVITHDQTSTTGFRVYTAFR